MVETHTESGDGLPKFEVGTRVRVISGWAKGKTARILDLEWSEVWGHYLYEMDFDDGYKGILGNYWIEESALESA